MKLCLMIAALLMSGSAVFSLPECQDYPWTNCYGTWTESYGDKYVGEWKDAVYDGQGALTKASGTKYVGDAGSAPLKVGETGAIEVKGPNVFKGYWKMPAKTASEFRADGFFVTGDLGNVDDRGYLKIVGRDKDLVISGGYNIYPKEIELVIDAVPGVLESAVIGVPMADLGEAVMAVVVSDGETPINSADILCYIKPKLARYKQPRRIFLVDELPRNVMGKVMKNKLRDTYATAFETPNI